MQTRSLYIRGSTWVALCSIVANISFLATFCQAQNLLDHPQTIIYDESHNRYLLSSLMTGDIVQIDSMGAQSYFARATHMNAAMTISGNTVYGTSYDDERLRGYDLETGALVLDVAIPQTFQLLGIAADTSGHLYICDFRTSGGVIFKFRISSQTYSTFVSGLPPGAGGMVYDQPHNRLVVATYEGSNHPILAVDLADSTVTTLTTTYLPECTGISKDRYGRFYVTVASTQLVRFDADFGTLPVVVYQSNCPNGGMVFTDYNARHDVVAFTLCGWNSWGTLDIYPPTAVQEQPVPTLPLECKLEQNFPNPFNPSTTIKYQLPEKNHVMVKIYDVMGREVATLVDRVEEPGYKSVQFDANNLASGVYFCSLSTPDFVQTRRLLLLR
jgi:hypothetical protein